MKVLIGYDGSECADAALLDLQRAGLPDEVEAVVLSAADVFLPPNNQPEEEEFPLYVPHGVKLAWERARNAVAEAESRAGHAGDRVKQLFPRWKVKTEAVADTPHWAIILKCEEWRPDLTVVGSHGRTALGRIFLGSVSQKALYEVSSSVRIARGREVPENGPAKLVLGTDGSADSEEMIRVVSARRWKPGTEVKLVTAYETFHEYSIDPDVQMNRIRDIHAVARQALEESGLDVIPTITDEDPKSFLVREAKRWNADCIFLGAKGHRLFDRLLVGSVSSSVAARADCSVEVVRKRIS